MLDRGITSVFRFISTHPDMDHLDGIKAFFRQFGPTNFWDTDNTKELKDFDHGIYDPDDWEFYTSLRDGDPRSNPKRLTLYAGARGAYYNQDEFGNGGSDGLYVLAPTPELVMAANEAKDWNDSSYVILYRVGNNKRILFAGDSHDATWEYILANWKVSVADVDVLIAPHHGRDSDRDYQFLDIVKPKLTLFGNAPSEYLAYGEWNARDMMFITNNQAGTIILDVGGNNLDVYVSHEPFARAFVEGRSYDTEHCSEMRGWFIGRCT
jgi:beta-lactamase superfamily II metal-dependent hydrolase